MKLDKIDLKILEALQEDGRLTNQALAQMVALSPSACLERVKKLENEAIITGYTAQIDMNKLACYSAILVEVTLKNHRAEDFIKFEKAVAAMPEIVECYSVGGGIDYIVKFLARSIEHYQDMMDELLQGDIGIEKYFTYFVTRRNKSSAYPIRHFVDNTEIS